jgi:hypothetical protein
LVLALAALAPGALLAQATGNTQCSTYQASVRAYNVCNAAIDGTNLFFPAAGLVVGGGNPRMGTAGTLGGLGHLSLDLRIAATKARLPDISYSGTGTTVASRDTSWVPIPQLEAGLGLVKGGRTGFGGLDLLVSAAVIPQSLVNKVSNLSVDTTGTRIGSLVIRLGIGGRLQILKDQGPLPAISISAMHRTVPQVTYGNLATGSNYQYAVTLKEWNYRAIASKRVAIFSFAAGAGIDHYSGEANIAFRDPITNTPQTPIALTLNDTRTVFFGDAGFDLGGFRIMAEGGWQQGKNLQQVTTFQGTDPKAARYFAGASIGFAF